MRFSQLHVGDFFRAHGDTYLKLPQVVKVELPGANAINAVTGQLAFFGLTVPVEYTLAKELGQDNGRLQDPAARNSRGAFTTRRFH